MPHSFETGLTIICRFNFSYYVTYPMESDKNIALKAKATLFRYISNFEQG